jgi:hypothetical protein
MELYWQIHGPHPSCKSYEILQKILAAGKPAVNLDSPRITELVRREQTVFYPRGDIEKLLGNKSIVTSILRCVCESCSKRLRMSDVDRDEITNAVLNPERPKILLLAVLVYIGYAFMIKQLSRLDGIHDSALALTSQRLDENSWAEILDTSLVHGKIDAKGAEKRDCLLENYSFAADLFNAPIFSTSKLWTEIHSRHRRFPFLDDQHHGFGSFGEVRKFNIHPDYLETNENIAATEWYREAKKV